MMSQMCPALLLYIQIKSYVNGFFYSYLANFWSMLCIWFLSLYCIWYEIIQNFSMQKQRSRGVLKKSWSENMQQIYRKTSMPKCDFNNVACISMDVHLWICCIVSELLFLRRPLGGCLCWCLLIASRINLFEYHQELYCSPTEPM